MFRFRSFLMIATKVYLSQEEIQEVESAISGPLTLKDNIVTVVDEQIHRVYAALSGVIEPKFTDIEGFDALKGKFEQLALIS
jgi:hypothetical protein